MTHKGASSLEHLVGKKILLVEDNHDLSTVLALSLIENGFSVVKSDKIGDAFKKMERARFDLIISDMTLPDMSGLMLLSALRARPNVPPVLIISGTGNVDSAVESMKMGAADYLAKPFTIEELCRRVQDILAIDAKSAGIQSAPEFLTCSDAVTRMIWQADRVAPLNTPVLIVGESGTGKELLARRIFEHSKRATMPFVAANCAAFAEQLLESEFFGHEAGSFTGAVESRSGIFEQADGGTLFLDEVGDMPLPLQVKLLRVIQESEVRRLGGNYSKKIDVRLISATNKTLEEEIAAGKFRIDLYYRLGVVILEIPPLRTRPEDIELLTNHFVRKISDEYKTRMPVITVDGLQFLQDYDWPGNVRELESLIQRVLVMSPRKLTAEVFSAYLKSASPISVENQLSLSEISGKATREAEERAIRRALSETKGNKTKAAKLLNVSYKTLINKCKELEL